MTMAIEWYDNIESYALTNKHVIAFGQQGN